MNAITKLANVFRDRTGFTKEPANKSGDAPKARKTAMYTESGWTAEVEIVSDDSDDKHYRYTLRVIQTLADGYLGRLHDGHVFNVFADKRHMAYCGWKLNKTG